MPASKTAVFFASIIVKIPVNLGGKSSNSLDVGGALSGEAEVKPGAT